MFNSVTKLAKETKLGEKALPKLQLQQRFYRSLITGLVTAGSLFAQSSLVKPLQAQTTSYCQFTPEAIASKENLLQASLQSDPDAQNRYNELLKQHAEILRQCRSKTWPQEQAIWLRPYPCDARPGAIAQILDRIVNQGYNKVYLEVFSDGQVLLPAADNPTPWIPVVRSQGKENVDLLAEVIEKGHERGLEVDAWLFTMNFGYTYAQRPDRQQTLARNGKGENSLAFVDDGSQAFIDPYNRQAKIDYYHLVEAVARRNPDGVLFDYLRYPRGTGTKSVVSDVKDLWIYSDAAREALYQRAQNNKGRALIERFISRGNITVGDIVAVDKLHPQEGPPMWQGRTPILEEGKLPASARIGRLRQDLWNLTVAHAAQGILDFLKVATLPLERQGISTGAVFFSDANLGVGERGYDSRLQPWDKFPASMEWHPMSYGVCGNTGCIVNQVKQVVEAAPGQTQVIPALAGAWGQSYNGRPPLEAQMQSIRQLVPQINAVSHFAFSWQNPQLERDRKFCRVE